MRIKRLKKRGISLYFFLDYKYKSKNKNMVYFDTYMYHYLKSPKKKERINPNFFTLVNKYVIFVNKLQKQNDPRSRTF